VRVLLDTIERPRVLDLGGNIGLFAQFVFGQLPAAVVTSVEADPGNAAVLLDVKEAGGHGDAWRLIEAAAGDAPGRAAFRADGSPQSRLVATAIEDEALVEVEVIDALPLLDDADLVKMDIEGGEWPLLADPRLADSRVRALVLEFHDHMCPGQDSARTAVDLLERAGFRIIDGPRSDPRHCGPDVGTLWAVKEAR
jgi:FkbM family methyltransferase